MGQDKTPETFDRKDNESWYSYLIRKDRELRDSNLFDKECSIDKKCTIPPNYCNYPNCAWGRKI
jgi:hypothetical protein